MNKLNNKTAIVTGGGSGIGRGIAITLANEGAFVTVCGRRIDKINETIEIIKQNGGIGLAVKADISKPEDVQILVHTSLNRFNRIDILVNNAGIGNGTQIHESNVADWDKIMATNLRGPFLTVREVLPVMRSQKSGHIINISSESGIEHYKGDAIYGTSKHALNEFGEYIQRENQELNIRVNTICPGMVVSEMTENEIGLDHSKCLFPEDIADLVIWLVTRRSNIKIGTPILIQTMLNPWE